MIINIMTSLKDGWLAKVSLLVSIILFMVSCNHKKESSMSNIEDSLQQPKEALLIGVSEAICYSGFRNGQHPDRGNGAINPSYEEILEDLNILSEKTNLQLIRVYDSGENSEMILKVIKENNINIKVLLGIWLRAELSNHVTCEWLTEPIPEEELNKNKDLNLKEIERGIKLANEYSDIIIAVNVGNEALVDWNDHKVDTDTIISYVRHVKQLIDQPVTVADNYKWWAEHGEALSKVVDFVSIHFYPIWEGKGINEGLSYSIENVMEVRNAIPEVKIVITEAGWPSIASEFPDQANEKNQQRYFEEFMAWSKEMNITTFWFEAFDEDWKGNPDSIIGAEKHWGLFNIDRTPKRVMEHIYSQNR